MADISKIKLANGTVVNLKDAAYRANFNTLLGSNQLKALEAAAWKAVASEITNSANLPTAQAVKEYVDSAVEAIPEFDVVIDSKAADKDEPATAPSAKTFHKIYLVSGGVSGSYTEYITIRSGEAGSYTYRWERIGSLDADFSAYVKKTTTIAGIDLKDNITVAELQDALELGDMAYADTATGSTTLQTIDSITMDAVTVAGNAAVTSSDADATLTKAAYTPAGSITGSAISGGSINVTLKDAATESTATLTRADYTPSGDVTVTLKNANVLASVATAGTLPSKAADSFTANTPTTIDVNKFNGGSAATWTGASHTSASLGNATKSAFATEGLVASIDEDDAEMLVFDNAGKSNAVTEQGTFTPDEVSFGTFNGGTAASLAAGFYTAGTAATFEEGTFNAGAMPTFNEGIVAVNTAKFVGDEVKNFQVTGVGYSKQVVDTKTFTPVAAELGFSGTTVADALVTGVSYKKADATAAFSETVTPTVASYSKTPKTIEITVSPNA